MKQEMISQNSWFQTSQNLWFHKPPAKTHGFTNQLKLMVSQTIFLTKITFHLSEIKPTKKISNLKQRNQLNSKWVCLQMERRLWGHLRQRNRLYRCENPSL